MAVPTNTLQTYQAGTNAEDVSDLIYNITPFETPFQKLCKKGKAEATYTEWPIDSLAAVDAANAVIEGDDATIDPLATPTRVGNYTQISDKTVSVSTTQEEVKKYGYAKAMTLGMMKRGRELKRDMETILLSNQARVVGAAGTAQKLRGLGGWLTTNASRGVGGANGTTTAAATDGTPRNFTEALLRGIVATIATNTNDQPSLLMAGPANRANISSQLNGNGTRFYEVNDSALNASISVYNTDYGPIKIIMNRFQRERDMWFINPDFIETRFLEPLQQQDLAVTGLTRKKQLWANYTLAVLNEAAHGVLADLNTAAL